jgi:hypothetical protein
MKQETAAKKLALLLGLDPEAAAESFKEKPRNPQLSAKMEAIEEQEIQNFRAAQGIIYFFQAPELFTPKVCKWCKESFLVSRRNVAYCSYTCLSKGIEDLTGVEWTKKNDYELIIKEVYNGNEPIWIKNLDRIRAILDATPVPNVDALNPVPLPVGEQPNG